MLIPPDFILLLSSLADLHALRSLGCLPLAPFHVHLGRGPSGGLKSSVFISCSTSYQILQPRPQAVAVSFLCEPSAPGANLICLRRQGIGDSLHGPCC